MNPENVMMWSVATIAFLVAVAVLYLVAGVIVIHQKKSRATKKYINTPVYTHRKTGDKYKVICVGKNESDTSTVVIYQRYYQIGSMMHLLSGRDVIWVRSYNEFVDGRFVHAHGVKIENLIEGKIYVQ